MAPSAPSLALYQRMLMSSCVLRPPLVCSKAPSSCSCAREVSAAAGGRPRVAVSCSCDGAAAFAAPALAGTTLKAAALYQQEGRCDLTLRAGVTCVSDRESSAKSTLPNPLGIYQQAYMTSATTGFKLQWNACVESHHMLEIRLQLRHVS